MKTIAERSSWMLTLPLTGMALAYVFLVFLPNQRKIDALNGQLRAKQDVVAQADASLAAIAATESFLSRSQEYNSQCQRAIPHEKDLSIVFGRIHSAARQAGVTTKRFDPQPPVDYVRLRAVQVAMSYAGTFRQIGKFLQEIEKLNPRPWLENIEIEVGRDSQDGQVNAVMGIFVDKTEDLYQANTAKKPI